MAHKFRVGDRVIRVKGVYLGEKATVVRVSKVGVHILFENKNLRGDSTYHSGSDHIALIDPYDDLDID